MLHQSHGARSQLVRSVSGYAPASATSPPSIDSVVSPSLFQSVVTLIALPWQISHSCRGRHGVTLNDKKRQDVDKTEGVSERRDELR